MKRAVEIKNSYYDTTICDEWLNNFEAFKDWSLAHGYTEDAILQRKNYQEGFCPENCEWIPEKEINELKRKLKLEYKIYQAKLKSKQQIKQEKATKTDIDGYTLVYQPEHPRTKDGYIAEHRMIMENILGRFLCLGETVHHKDKNRTNNNPENLMLFENMGYHMKYHSLESYHYQEINKSQIENNPTKENTE